MNTDLLEEQAPSAFSVMYSDLAASKTTEESWFLVNDQRDAQILFYVFISIYNSLHVPSTSCSSSGETNCINLSLLMMSTVCTKHASKFKLNLILEAQIDKSF